MLMSMISYSNHPSIMSVDSLSLWTLGETEVVFLGNSNGSFVWNSKKKTTPVREILVHTPWCPLKLGAEGP